MIDELEGLYRRQLKEFTRAATAIAGDPELGRDAVQDAFAPILDFSIHGPSHLVRVGGIAADGITRVVVKDREGRGLVWLPVRDNVYDSGAKPLPAAAVQLAAEDAKGRVLATVPR